jgi:hypothetical protein
MSTYYVVVSALIFAIVAVGHAIRLVNRWAVQVGALFGPDVRIMDWPCNRCPDFSLGLRAISSLGAACPISNVPSSFPPGTIDI